MFLLGDILTEDILTDRRYHVYELLDIILLFYMHIILTRYYH